MARDPRSLTRFPGKLGILLAVLAGVLAWFIVTHHWPVVFFIAAVVLLIGAWASWLQSVRKYQREKRGP